MRNNRRVATLTAMRMRGVAAAVAGIVGAATVHVLDAYGALPGVHEAVSVRAAMGPLLTVVWLAVAAGLAWCAAQTRPMLVGAPSALIISAVPEIVGRHDLAALLEPGALAGAAVQWSLLLAVLAVLVLLDRVPSVTALLLFAQPCRRPPSSTVAARVPRLVDHRGRPRAPPPVLLSAHIS